MVLKDLLRDHLIPAVAAASLLGGGAAVIKNQVTLAEHDTRLSAAEDIDGKLDRIDERLDKQDQRLARIEAKLETK